MAQYAVAGAIFTYEIAVYAWGYDIYLSVAGRCITSDTIFTFWCEIHSGYAPISPMTLTVLVRYCQYKRVLFQYGILPACLSLLPELAI